MQADPSSRPTAPENPSPLLEAAVVSASNGVIITDAAGTILWVNPAFTRMTGYTKEEVIGKNPRILKSNQHGPEFYQQLWQTVQTGKVWSGTLCNRRKNGELYHEEMTITPMVNPGGQVTHFIAIKQDVTRQKELEEQLQQSQKMEAVGRLAAGVAHDFNNLLTIISGYSELLLSTLEEVNPMRELLRQIRDAGNRAATLTRQLLAFSRKTPLEPRVLDLNALVGDLSKLLGRLIGEDIALRVDLDPDLGRVFVDPGQLDQALINLAVNARDAMPQGGTLTLETRNAHLENGAAALARVRPGPYVAVSVRDTGCGMTEEVKARIFEPFFTTKESGKGTGLGLAMVYGFVKQSLGHVTVSSEPGRGSTFTLLLPRHVDFPSSCSATAARAAYPGGTETLLLVEDEETVRALTRHILASCGYSVLEARHGHEAMQVAAKHPGPIHLLITDVVMPGLSGRELAEALVRVRPETKVLYLSGYTDDTLQRHGLVGAGIAFLPKPFTAGTLARKVRELLDQSS